MVYAIVQRSREAGPGADYVYDVLRDSEPVAEFRHSFRGDEPMLRLPGEGWCESGWIIDQQHAGAHRISPEGAQMLDALLP